MIDERIFQQFAEIGRDLYVGRLTSSHGGNMSMRLGDQILITRRGAMLGRLRPGDLVETGLYKKDSGVVLASTELIVHRAIYMATPALAAIHAHPLTAVALSLSRQEIVPIDVEGSYLLKKVPVVTQEFASGTAQMAEAVANALKGYKILLVRGHGCFATGQTLDEAFQWVSTLEECCEIILRTKLIDEPLIEHRRMNDQYTRW